MGLERLTGTPWHVERFTRKEDDEKRHRSNVYTIVAADIVLGILSIVGALHIVDIMKKLKQKKKRTTSQLRKRRKESLLRN